MRQHVLIGRASLPRSDCRAIVVVLARLLQGFSTGGEPATRCLHVEWRRLIAAGFMAGSAMQLAMGFLLGSGMAAARRACCKRCEEAGVGVPFLSRIIGPWGDLRL